MRVEGGGEQRSGTGGRGKEVTGTRRGEPPPSPTDKGRHGPGRPVRLETDLFRKVCSGGNENYHLLMRRAERS